MYISRQNSKSKNLSNNMIKSIVPKTIQLLSTNNKKTQNNKNSFITFSLLKSKSIAPSTSNTSRNQKFNNLKKSFENLFNNQVSSLRNSTSKSTLRRKVIDIKPDTFRGLSVIAASRGTNLKNFIESSLDELVESYDDGAVYRYLRQTDPEGLEMVSEDEKQEFEKRLGL